MISDLTGGAWLGPAAVAMTAALCEQAATEARAAAAAYEAAFAMTVPRRWSQPPRAADVADRDKHPRLHVLAHGIGKTVLFLAGGQSQTAHGFKAIADITAPVRRSRVVRVWFAVGLIVLLGLPPFAMFANELAIARSLADARLAPDPGQSHIVAGANNPAVITRVNRRNG